MYRYLSQAHKLHDNIHDIDLSTMDARTVSEVKLLVITDNCVILGLCTITVGCVSLLPFTWCGHTRIRVARMDPLMPRGLAELVHNKAYLCVAFLFQFALESIYSFAVSPLDPVSSIYQ